MAKLLQRIGNWPERIERANWCVKGLARECGVSVRTLERHIKLKFGKCPQEWLLDLRMQRALELLPESSSIKAVALELRYKSQQHFSREFKKFSGHAPSTIQGASMV